ncbi:MAG: ATP-binding cassette domain-containing protein [Myxococcales bacterium]|nr:ATP-binding cassette domain-containing protein [Myxococcales bacterium]
MIQVSNLTKYYGGKRALGPVSFEIEKGETVGFLGLNGAGKTTALRVLACDLRPTAGAVSVGGTDALSNPHEVRRRIGFLPETPPLYTDMTVEAFLTFVCDLREVPSSERKAKIGDALALTDLTLVAGEPIGTLSHGYRQRVGVAQAIVHRPQLVILDEPTRGLDPRQVVEMRKLIHELKDKHTVLLSSHVLSEVSQTCDRLLVLGRGQILGSGTEAELAAQQEPVFSVEVTVRIPDGKTAAAATIVDAVAGVDGLLGKSAPAERGDGWELVVSSKRDVRAEISRAVIAAGLDLLRLDARRVDLENTFLRMVDVAPAAPSAEAKE